MAVEGLIETRTLLRQFGPDLLKRLDVKVNLVARRLMSSAEQNFAETGVPGGAYRIRKRNSVNKFSVSVITRPGSVSAGEKWSSSPGVLAAIFELANAVRNAKPQNIPRTKNLLATLNARYGRPGRFLWQAWDDEKEADMATVDAEIRAVEAEYTERMAV